MTTQAQGRSRTVFHPLTVSRVDALTDDSVAVTFSVPEDLRADFDFLPGQSLTLRRGDERRTYSICAAAGAAPRIGVREIPNGLFSSWLTREVRAGDVVEVQAPSGRFCVDAAAGGRHLCVAAGSGITPVLSICASLLGAGGEVTLLYGNRTSRTVMFADELADLKDRHGARFQLVHVLSREPRDVELFSGRLDGARVRRLVEALVPWRGLAGVWLCGPLAQVEDVRASLVSLGIPGEDVHAELFFVDEPPPMLRHPDAVLEGATTELSVTLDGRTTTGPMARGTSVLDAAQLTRADLPFACKGGVCGTCRAHLVDGEVEMARNYALSSDEVDQGFVLTCQSFPISEQVSVDFDA